MNKFFRYWANNFKVGFHNSPACSCNFFCCCCLFVGYVFPAQHGQRLLRMTWVQEPTSLSHKHYVMEKRGPHCNLWTRDWGAIKWHIPLTHLTRSFLILRGKNMTMEEQPPSCLKNLNGKLKNQPCCSIQMEQQACWYGKVKEHLPAQRIENTPDCLQVSRKATWHSYLQVKNV